MPRVCRPATKLLSRYQIACAHRKINCKPSGAIVRSVPSGPRRRWGKKEKGVVAAEEPLQGDGALGTMIDGFLFVYPLELAPAFMWLLHCNAAARKELCRRARTRARASSRTCPAARFCRALEKLCKIILKWGLRVSVVFGLRPPEGQTGRRTDPLTALNCLCGVGSEAALHAGTLLWSDAGVPENFSSDSISLWPGTPFANQQNTQQNTEFFFSLSF